MAPRTALVTGGNRGIGLEVCRQLGRKGLTVILGARREEKAREAARQLAGDGLEIVGHALDVTDPAAVNRLEVFMRRSFGRLDVLINNAALYFDSDTRNTLQSIDLETVRLSMEANLYGPLRLCRTFAPWMIEQGYGRIVNVSTSMAQLSTMNGGWAAYRMSKVALNALTRVLADEVRGHNLLVNCVSPGWVRTEMGGPEAPLSVEEGADTIVWAATLPDGGPSGQFLRERQSIDW